ncbi:transporter substrate-binding domain-containing protein [Kordiimonas sp. SCSIO 12610]|uniref:transporter substrate-binding domain-containing protein n=1 Tax=Kordiimonas sp. SCSIO 12610 TaxID=2829597 RepID=UPI002109FEB1|nr:transporter substrate-binding domain-containing protein [Kordiimonas sp. SCSIO 12610]UTW56093.1 transporter substrate-binding domain-containing protein [Kordiimonas sp. SCSIO 12610]
MIFTWIISTVLILNTTPLLASDYFYNAITSPKITISGSIIQRVYDPREPGIYNKLIEQLVMDTSYQVDTRFYPLRRAQEVFLKTETDCYFIADNMSSILADRKLNEEDFVHSVTLNDSYIRVYTRMDQALIENLSELERAIVAADPGTGLGYALRQSMPKTTSIISTDSIEKSLELLKIGRVNAVVAYDLDMDAYLRASGTTPNIQSSTAFSIAHGHDSLVCWNTEENRSFLEKINNRLETLKSQRTLVTLTNLQ